MDPRIYDLTLGAADLGSVLAACIAGLGGAEKIREASLTSVEFNFHRGCDDLTITAAAFEGCPADVYLSLASRTEGEFALIHPPGDDLGLWSGECELLDADPRLRFLDALAVPGLRFAVLAHDEGTFPSDSFLAGDEDVLEYQDCVLLAVTREGAEQRWTVREPYGPQCNPAAPVWLGGWLKRLQKPEPGKNARSY